MVNFEKQIIDREKRGLIPAARFSCRFSEVRWGYEISKHAYMTNRLALIKVWDVYKFPWNKKDKPIVTFKTLKAARAYVDDKEQTKLDL